MLAYIKRSQSYCLLRCANGFNYLHPNRPADHCSIFCHRIFTIKTSFLRKYQIGTGAGFFEYLSGEKKPFSQIGEINFFSFKKNCYSIILYYIVLTRHHH